MAETVLAGWNYPKAASHILIDAATTRILHQDGVTVSNVASKEKALAWIELENADEIRFVQTDGNEALYQELIGSEHMGAKVLQVVSLAKGYYSLRIDGKLLSQKWDEKQLEAGIHLDRLDTPAHRAGVAVYYACSDSELNQTDRSRLVGTLEGQPKDIILNSERLLLAAVEEAERKIEKSSQRLQHQFELRLVEN
jgi:hypothetical protein